MAFSQPFFSSMEPEFAPVVHDYVQHWDVSGVLNWLQSIELEKYTDIFRRNNITGQVLLEIEPSSLKEMGVNKIGDRIRIASQIKTFRNTECKRISRAQLNRESLELLESAAPSILALTTPRSGSTVNDSRADFPQDLYMHSLHDSQKSAHLRIGSARGNFPPHSASLLPPAPGTPQPSSRLRFAPNSTPQSSLRARRLNNLNNSNGGSNSIMNVPTPSSSIFPAGKPLIRVIFENGNSSVVNIEGCKTADDIMLKSLRKGQMNETLVREYCFYELNGSEPDPRNCAQLSDADLMEVCTEPGGLERSRLILCNVQGGGPDLLQLRAAAKIANNQFQAQAQAQHQHQHHQASLGTSITNTKTSASSRNQIPPDRLMNEPLAAMAYPPSLNEGDSNYLDLDSAHDLGTIPLPGQERPVSKMKELWGGRPPSELIASDLPTYFPQYDKSEIDKTVRMSMRRSRRISRATNRLSTFSTFSISSNIRDAPPMPSISDHYLAQGAKPTFRPYSSNRGGSRDSVASSSFLGTLEEEDDSPEDSHHSNSVPYVTFTPTSGPGLEEECTITGSSFGHEGSFVDRPLSNADSSMSTESNDWVNKRISQMVQEDGDEEDSELSDYLENNSWDNVKYMKGALIGQGSFGSVYLALHAVTGELMAVKQVEAPRESEKDAKKDSMIEALKHEIGLLRELKHENIVQYLGSNSDETHLNIFLEYVPGGSVARMLVNYGPLPEGMIQNFVRQILQGLAYLHSQDIIHRDIKGANILVDNKGAVKISDFGISKRVEASTLLSNKGARVSMQGSVFWMAPEVVKQTSYTKKSDIWSLGCLVVEMYTGSHPHPNCSQIQAIFKIGSMADCSPTVPDDASDGMKKFLKCTFEIDHEKRPTAEALLQSEFCTTAMQ